MNHPTEAIAVREAVVADAPAFATFMHRAWREAGPDAPGFAGATEESIAEIASQTSFERSIGGPDRRMFLAGIEGEVVGFAATRREDDTTVELAGIVILSTYAGQGVGTALVDASVAAARAEGYATMLVKTETSNHRARDFYEKLGFHLESIATESVDATAVELGTLSRPL